MKVINFFGGPGTGKSTHAAELFAALKKMGVEVELVTEYAKQLTWENRSTALSNQIYVFAKQLHNLHRLGDKVPLVITDSPLLLSIVYKPNTLPSSYDAVVVDTFKQYDNINILLERTVPYNPVGRNQDLTGAQGIDRRIKDVLHYFSIPYTTVDPLNYDIQRLIELISN